MRIQITIYNENPTVYRLIDAENMREFSMILILISKFWSNVSYLAFWALEG